MRVRVFAFGTLKRGFPLHEEAGLSRTAFLSVYRTLKSFPLVIAGPRFAPMMLFQPGVGHSIEGELFSVDPGLLAKIDRIESVEKPGNERRVIDVVHPSTAETCSALVYVKAAYLAEPIHSPMLSRYELDPRFVKPSLES